LENQYRWSVKYRSKNFENIKNDIGRSLLQTLTLGFIKSSVEHKGAEVILQVQTRAKQCNDIKVRIVYLRTSSLIALRQVFVNFLEQSLRLFISFLIFLIFLSFLIH